LPVVAGRVQLWTRPEDECFDVLTSGVQAARRDQRQNGNDDDDTHGYDDTPTYCQPDTFHFTHS